MPVIYTSYKYGIRITGFHCMCISPARIGWFLCVKQVCIMYRHEAIRQLQ